MEGEDKQNPLETVSGPGVLEKYQKAGEICNNVLAKVLERCTPNASIHELCAMGDKLIEEATGKCYTKNVKASADDKDAKPEKMEKGVGYPTTISVNEVCGHYSPCKSDDTPLKEGDLAKVNVGVQIDGYVCQLGHTVVVGGGAVSGRKADVTMAAWNGLQAAVRLLKPGNTNTQITNAIETCSDSYKVNPVEGVLSHEVQRWLIDGNNVILNKETHEAKVSECEFGVNQIFILDVYCSTGEGKPKESEYRMDVYKRDLDANADLKSKNARQFFSEVRKRHGPWPFAIRSFEDELMARAGTQECISSNIIAQYPVVAEKSGELVAQFQWTVLISNKRTILLTSHMLDEANFKADGAVTDQGVKDLLAVPLSEITAAKKKGKK